MLNRGGVESLKSMPNISTAPNHRRCGLRLQHTIITGRKIGCPRIDKIDLVGRRGIGGEDVYKRQAQACSGVTVTDEDTTTCNIATTPAIVVTKVCSSGLLQPGGLLTYSGSVSNAGNITLIEVTVVDSASPNNSPLPGSIDLAPGQSVSFSGSYICLLYTSRCV